jgi:hypothetical protein
MLYWIHPSCLSVHLCPIISAFFQPTILIMREDYLRTNGGWIFDPLSRVFPLYFVHFWENISVFELISQINSKLQIFQDIFPIKVLDSPIRGSNPRIPLFLQNKKKESSTHQRRLRSKNELLNLMYKDSDLTQ